MYNVITNFIRSPKNSGRRSELYKAKTEFSVKPSGKILDISTEDVLSSPENGLKALIIIDKI